MEYVQLGKTGLKVSKIGLGASGPSRLGLAYGATTKDAARIIHLALDMGINFLDLSAFFSSTEEAVAEALKYRRDHVVLSAKVNVAPQLIPPELGRNFAKLSARIGAEMSLVMRQDAFRRCVEKLLRLLNIDTLDILSLHAVTPGQFRRARGLLPVMEKLKDEGKVRALGISEAFLIDPGHLALAKALQQGGFDMVMAGFNLLNQSARETVFQPAQARNVGSVAMFAARQRPSSLVNKHLDRHGRSSASGLDELSRLMDQNGIANTAELAYRFCTAHSGADVTLIGTGNEGHLRENVRACLDAELPESLLDVINARSWLNGL